MYLLCAGTGPRARASKEKVQICPAPECQLPVGSVFSPSSQHCVQNTGHADEWVLSKVLLHFREQLPWVAIAQKTPTSGNGLGKGDCSDLETAQFLWWFKINRHKTTTTEYLLVSSFLAPESLPKGVVVLRPRKVVGQRSRPLHEVCPVCTPLCHQRRPSGWPQDLT